MISQNFRLTMEVIDDGKIARATRALLRFFGRKNFGTKRVDFVCVGTDETAFAAVREAYRLCAQKKYTPIRLVSCVRC